MPRRSTRRAPPASMPPVPSVESFDSAPSRQLNLSLLQLVAGLVAVVLLLCFGYLLGRSTTRPESVAGRNSLDLETLWAPFLSRKLPLILSIEDPLFAEIRSNPGVYFRDRSMNEWSDVVNSAALNKLTGALNQSEMHPSRYYTAFGEAEASFLLGGLLKTPESALSIVRTSQLSWQQLADNNVIFVGVQNLFFNQLRNMPITPQLVPRAEWSSGRTSRPTDDRVFMLMSTPTAPSEQGTIYALVTHLPGPNGKNDIESFTSNRSAGYLGAVQSFTDPQFARMLAIKLKEESGGKVPRFYQVLFQVRYRDGVPTETKFVLGREMH